MLIGNINPVNLRGLKQALFVLQSLEQGKTADQIVDRFDGDRQLVEIWTNFLVHNQWIKLEVNNGIARYVATNKGIEWLNRLKTQEAEVG